MLLYRPAPHTPAPRFHHMPPSLHDCTHTMINNPYASHPQDHLLEVPESLVRPQAVSPCQVLCNNQPCIPVIRLGVSSACTCSNLHHPASHSHPQTITYPPHPVDTRISLGLPMHGHVEPCLPHCSGRPLVADWCSETNKMALPWDPR